MVQFKFLKNSFEYTVLLKTFKIMHNIDYYSLHAEGVAKLLSCTKGG